MDVCAFVRLECQQAGTHMFPYMLVDKVKDSVWSDKGRIGHPMLCDRLRRQPQCCG